MQRYIANTILSIAFLIILLKKKHFFITKVYMSINDRIKHLIKVDEQNTSSFAEKIGFSQVALSNLFIRETSPSYKMLSAILDAYPDLSTEWLLLGEGEMWKSQRAPLPPPEVEVAQHPNQEELIQLYREQIAILKEYIRENLPDVAKRLGF